jgi:peptide/nickel transport system substrate-binding protein
MSEDATTSTSLTRRDILKAGGAAVIAATGPQLRAAPAAAQTPKRGGILRIAFQSDPVTGFDPQQTISFVTQVPLSFVYSRLMKVKAGPSVKPMTYPIEPDLAESWTQPNETTYVFKLKKGVRWHPKPPVNGRELTAEDVKYSFDRFLNVTGNPNRPTLESIDRVEALDKYTVKFTLREPNAWFLDLLASTSTWIIARECVEKYGDLKKVESVVGTGPWMLERWESNVRMTFVRNPNYFVPGLPYADGVDMLIDKDPSSRLAAFLAGKIDFGPEYQQVVRRIDLDLVKQRKPGVQTAEYTWFTAGAIGIKIEKPPFNDIRVRRALARATNLQELYDANAFSQGHWTPNPVVPAAALEWSIPIDQLGPEGRKNYQPSLPEAKRLLAEAGYPNGVKVTADAPGTGYGPDFLDAVQINLKNWKAAGIDVDLKLKEYGAFISTAIYGKFDQMYIGLRGAWVDPESYFYRFYMPEQPMNVMPVNDPKLTELIKLQRRTFDVSKRRQIVYDVQRYAAEAGYWGVDGSVNVVSAWESYIKNYMPNNGFDFGGRLMAAWIDK